MSGGAQRAFPRPDFLDNAMLEEAAARLRAAQAVQALGHVRPDGDCIGSLLTVHHILNHLKIPHALAAEKIPAGGYTAMRDYALIREQPAPHIDGRIPDLIVYVDAASKERARPEYMPVDANGVAIPALVIDHHGTNTRFGTWHWIEPRCAATCEMLFYLAQVLGVPLSPDMAEAMLVGISTDTGGYRFPNTGPVQHEIAAELIRAGAGVDKVTRMAWSSTGPEGLRLAGHVMHTMQLQGGGALAWAEIREPVYAAHGGEMNAPENLGDVLRSVKGVRVGLLFHEINPTTLRANFRSDGTVNVSAIAQEFGGGGHPAAAGLTLQTKDYSADRDRILARVLAELKK